MPNKNSRPPKGQTAKKEKVANGKSSKPPGQAAQSLHHPTSGRSGCFFLDVLDLGQVVMDVRSGGANQDSNRKLKMIAALAGINTNMANGGDGITPKSALINTHTARRNAATNLLLDGVPISEIMQLGGWKNEATLRHYLLAGGIQLARLSADRAFFL